MGAPGQPIRAVEVYGKFHKCKRIINLHKIYTGEQKWIAQISPSLVSAQECSAPSSIRKGTRSKILKFYKMLGDHLKVMQGLNTVNSSSI